MFAYYKLAEASFQAFLILLQPTIPASRVLQKVTGDSGIVNLEGPTRKPRHASIFSMHSDT